MSRLTGLGALLLLGFALSVPAVLARTTPADAPSAHASHSAQTFKTHLASRNHCAAAQSRWRRHYAPFTRRLAHRKGEVRQRFDAVVTQLVAARLPAEYAAIPFVESHNRANARSGLGPAGLWQFTAQTARNHGLKVNGKVDERMDAERSTRAAVKYLKYLHRKFKGDWEHVLMAFNAGEGRFLAHRRQGKGLSPITRVYPRKVEAIVCNVLETER